MSGNRNLEVIENKSLTVWEGDENLRQVRAIFAPTLTELEFTMFVEMGKATSLNPFLKEIWAVKYDKSKPAQIFIGRDGYRKTAQRHPLYDYHTADAVYSNDDFQVKDGEVFHKYCLKDRGTLVGAYCTVHRKGSSKAGYVYVDFAEYNLKQSVWNQKPATMIKKVAEAQALKSSFQELFAGSYNEFEEFDQQRDPTAGKPGKGVQGLKEKLGIAKPAEADTVDYDTITGEVVEEVEEVDIFGDIDPEIDPLDEIRLAIQSATNSSELLVAARKGNDMSDDAKKQIREMFNRRSVELKNGVN